MAKLPSLGAKKIVKALLRSGFYIHHQSGSHIQLRHHKKRELRVTVPYHTRFDLPPDVVASILKQADISRDEFIELL